ncbi:uncharacterized protein LOC113370033 [Ctenocephalides felis]|uniref:uncharacterized protein LOC113370033 n=1 Tax=Ctenocephalides felis TaxID=7515 RepID=UPI000E6E4C1E|nr:uncharacterized protein LOC113370033 [Ctenocephalides felis]
MIYSLILLLCVALSGIGAIPIEYADPTVEKEDTTLKDFNREMDENIEMLNEIQEKVNLLSSRMQKYRLIHANVQENEISTDDIISSDCSGGCDKPDNSSVTNITLTIKFGGFASSDDDTNSYPLLGAPLDGNTNFITEDEDLVTGDQTLHYPAEMPPEVYNSNPKNDVEIFDPKDSVDQWPVDSFRDRDTNRHWIIAASDIDHDSGLVDTNIFTSRDMDYPEIRIYQDSMGNIDEEAIRMHQERHRQNFADLFRSIFE